MTKQYWVGGFFIDLSRNQITQNNQSQTIAPKAMAVLTHLAENQGKVVSQDTLLNEVWPDTIVTPNTLQRSIAQLRKALGDDAKVQVYIKTHAKQGYSLECDVRWHDNNNSTRANYSQENEVNERRNSQFNSYTDSDSAYIPQSSRPGFRLISVVLGIIVLAFIAYKYMASSETPQLSFDKLTSITATDDKEFDATYTPDGKYIVFHRYLDQQCGNKIWAKNIRTQKEIQLTQDWGAYGSHSFSQDGKKMVFIATEACSEPVTQTNCYDLVSLDFEQALISPQQPSLMLQCQNSIVRKPIWLNNNDVALLQNNSNRWKLITYSISNNESTDLYDLKEGNLIDFVYSGRDDLIAVTSIHNDGQQYIEMLKPDGRILSSHIIEFPHEIPRFRLIYPNFDHLNKQLIFSTGRQLFTLSYEGKVKKISLPSADRMMQPVFHPDGKSLLMIKGPYDNDIVLLPLNQLAEESSLISSIQSQANPNQEVPNQEGPNQENQNQEQLVYSSFERTTLGENNAIFQPTGELIAFWSERSGEQQIWLSDKNGDGNGPQQLTQFPMDSSIGGFDWAADGQSLLVNANNALIQIFLDSSQKIFSLEHAVIRLFQWDSKNMTALMYLRIKGVSKFVEYDFNNASVKEINDKIVLWALKSEDGRLIYKDHLSQFWQPGPAEDQLIMALSNQELKAKSFVIKDNVIYAINKENQLWSYDLNSKTKRILGRVSEDVDQLTDINQTQLLMTITVNAKKGVVELSLSE